MKLRTAEYRVGLVGMYYSGKTMFLTSLINHLRDHDPERFPLGKDGARLRKFHELRTDSGWPQFPYDFNRDRLLRNGTWPAKTTDRSQFVCEFQRTDWRMHTARLKLYDFPGERVADAIMAGLDYAGWSDHMFRILDTDWDYHDCCHDYLKLLDREYASADELLREYRVGLAQLILRYKPYVSPSIFYLDTKGEMIRVRTAEGEPFSAQDMADKQGRHAGLTGDTQFAPLSAPVRAARGDLARLFAERYEHYKKEAVLPLVGALRSCHALVYLVDVTTVLASGHGMYNDNQHLLEDVLEVLQPGQTLLGKAIRGSASLLLPPGWRPGGIIRIAFAAPKLDLVCPDERGKLCDLVRRFAQRAAQNRDGLQALYTNCSSVVSTTHFVEDGKGCALSGQVKGQMQKFACQKLPLAWPLEWKAGEYTFPCVRPLIPPLRDAPPNHVNLDELFNFIVA